MRKTTLNFLKIFFSLAILVFLFYKVGVKELYLTMLSINPFYVLLALFFIFIQIFLSVLNLKILLVPFKQKISFLKLTKMYLYTWYISTFTPGRFGDLSIVYFLNKKGINVGIGSAITLIDKIITLVITLVFALYGLFLFFTVSQSIKFILILSLFLVFFIILISGKGRALIRKHILRKYSVMFKGFAKTLILFLRKHKKLLLYNSLLTLLRWVFNAVVIYYLFLAVGLSSSMFMILVINSIAMFVSLIPISANGLGIREGTVVYLFGKLGYPSVLVLDAYLILVVLKYIISLLNVIVFLDKEDLKFK